MTEDTTPEETPSGETQRLISEATMLAEHNTITFRRADSGWRVIGDMRTKNEPRPPTRELIRERPSLGHALDCWVAAARKINSAVNDLEEFFKLD